MNYISPNTQDKFQNFGDLLLKWNQTHNLSGAKDFEAFFSLIEDSLYPLCFIQNFDQALDIGSGAGFPSIALAIARPQSLFFLTEPRKKRASFLQTLKIELGLENIEILPCRLQEASLSPVDLITSKAVAPTPHLIEMSKDLLRPCGAFLFYKGSKLLDEGEKIAEEEIFTSPQGRIYFYRRRKC